MTPRTLAPLLAVLALLAGCGRTGSGERDPGGASSDLAGRVQADGSSTVAPLTTLAAERFRERHPGVEVTVGVSGTGGGFERFCAGETDLSDASRPIKDEEAAACREQGVEYVELHVANDALTVVANRANDWATCLTVAQLKRIWEPKSNVDSWDDVERDFPAEKLLLFGPGTDSGTFDYFTDAVVGEEGASRADYSASEDDNVIVQGVGGERGGLGYLGFSYFEQNADRLKALAVDGGEGCVEPSREAAQSGRYVPLARPLFVYARKESLRRAEVRAFLEFVLDNAPALAEDALFVPLTDEQARRARGALDAAAGA